jgi:REP-associated tyrosine transposase
MSRAPRAFAPGIYHVFARGSNRQAIFSSDSDRIDFLHCLDRVVARSQLRCLAYCLMANHYHLVFETSDGELSAPMKALNGGYSLRFNRRYARDAHLFKNRFGAVRQELDGQLLWTVRYAVRNPVESGVCRTPADWPWSSYRASAGLERAPRFLAVARLLSFFGAVPHRARSTYRAFVNDYVGV